jgi:hypothetical protein
LIFLSISILVFGCGVDGPPIPPAGSEIPSLPSLYMKSQSNKAEPINNDEISDLKDSSKNSPTKKKAP